MFPLVLLGSNVSVNPPVSAQHDLYSPLYTLRVATLPTLRAGPISTLRAPPPQIVVTYEDSMDTSRHVITLNINTGGSGFDPTTLYDPASGRLGIVFRLGGLYRRRRYSLQVVAFQGSIRAAHSRLAFLTGEDDGEDKLYNLTGIILVLGISTIIMVVVMVCVGYEKLIHQKKEECCSFICCRKRKKRPPKSSISPEPLVVRDGRGAGESPSTSSQRY
nr:uncharacterized protein LOC128704197 [Cherax quadricarinatus]